MNGIAISHIGQFSKNELIQMAYLELIASMNNLTVKYTKKADFGIDMELAGQKLIQGHYRESSTRLSIQNKASSQWSIDYKSRCIKYPLRGKNYNDMVARNQEAKKSMRWAPIVLALMCLPKKQKTCIYKENNLSCKLYHRCFWFILPRETVTMCSDKSKKTVAIPIKQVLNTKALNVLWAHAENYWEDRDIDGKEDDRDV